MRIIAGEFKGRTLVAPPGRDTRPMLDRIREAVFSSLSGWLDGAQVLDLYAGSGSIGLEALSRGANFVRFVEQSKAARGALRRNFENMDVHERVELMGGTALGPVAWAPPEDNMPPGWADIVFLDPPYPHSQQEPERAELLNGLISIVEGVLAPEGVAILHTAPRALDETDFPDDWDVLKRVYGRSAIWFLQRAGDEA